MRTYVVDSDFWEDCWNRIKRFTNVQWLAAGAGCSGIIFLWLLFSVPERSQHALWDLQPFEIEIIPLPSSSFSKRTLKLTGNVNATKLYLVPQRCPPYEVTESAAYDKDIDVRHGGKHDDEYLLQAGSHVKWTVDKADGDIRVYLFSNRIDAEIFGRRPSPGSKETYLYADVVTRGKLFEYAFEPFKSESYVFLYQSEGPQSGTAARAHYDIQQSNYNVEGLTSFQKEEHHCTYKDCRIPLSRAKQCIVLENVHLTHDVSMVVDVVVKNHYFSMLLVSLIPLLLAGVYIKFGKEPNLVVGHGDGHSGGHRMIPGYELVGGDQF